MLDMAANPRGNNANTAGGPAPLLGMGNKWLGSAPWSPRWSAFPASRNFSVDSAMSVGTVASVASVGSPFDDDEDRHAAGTLFWITAQLARLVVHRPLTILLGWFAVFTLSSFFAVQFFLAVRASSKPEPNMPSGQSMVMFEKYFPGLMDQVVDSVIFSMSPEAEHWKVDPLLSEAVASLRRTLDSVQDLYSGVEFKIRSWEGTDSGFGASYIARDGRSWLLQVVWLPSSAGEQPGVRQIAAFEFLGAVHELNKSYASQGLVITAAGPDALSSAIQMQTRHDVGLHATMFLPFALLVMHVNLCNCMLLLLPVLCSLVSVVVGFAVGFIVASHCTVDASVPTLMAFLSIALSVDWSFFLLARVQEEMAKGDTHRNAVIIALSRTGANVALSGFLIVVCSACLLLMPAAIASTAVGGIIAVSSTLLCCLTLLPACLVVLPAKLAERCCPLGSAPRTVQAERAHSDTEGEDGGVGNDMMHFSSALWYAWATRVTAYPCNLAILLTTCLLLMPLSLRLAQYVPAIDDMYLPESAPELLAQAHLHQDFEGLQPSGSQFSVLVEANPSCWAGVTSNDYFAALCSMAADVLRVGTPTLPIAAENLTGVAFYTPEGQEQIRCIPWTQEYQSTEEAYGAMLNHSFSGHLLKTGHTSYYTEIPSDAFMQMHALYAQMWERCVSSSNGASIIAVQVPWSLRSWEGFRMIDALRAVLPSQGGASGRRLSDCRAVRAWELSETSIWYDTITKALRMLPWSLTLAFVVSTLFLALSFRTAVGALKLLLTVVLPLSWVYGLAVLCFQDGLLDFAGPRSPFRSASGLHWIVPCSSSMLLLSLALDYNVFYFGRVLEFRKAGAGDLEAVRQGLASTGPVITCAGLIFAIEFSGLLCSEAELNRQAGFVMVLGILLDTFLLRSCLMPALLSLGASWNWWPTQMPPPVLHEELCFSDDDGQ